MKKWKKSKYKIKGKEYISNEYFMGNKETIEINTTDKTTAKFIQDRINGVYECMDWSCDWCGHRHTDDRDYGDYVNKVDEYVGDFGTELTQAIDNKKSYKYIRDIVEE